MHWHLFAQLYNVSTDIFVPLLYSVGIDICFPRCTLYTVQCRHCNFCFSTVHCWHWHLFGQLYNVIADIFVFLQLCNVSSAGTDFSVLNCPVLALIFMYPTAYGVGTDISVSLIVCILKNVIQFCTWLNVIEFESWFLSILCILFCQLHCSSTVCIWALLSGPIGTRDRGITIRDCWVSSMEEIWSNHTYVALALFSLLATCVVF